MSKRIRKYQYTTKTELVKELYQLQEPVCPLCKRSLLPELQLWLMWHEKKSINGNRVRRKDANINIDHIVPVSEGGTDDLDNLALTHRRCNDIRANALIYDARPERKKQRQP